MAKHAQTPAPMEALLAAELPEGEGWQYEPKWDGFRALARRDGEEVALISRSGKQLGRYFPEVLGILRSLKERHFLLDGELIITVGGALSFEALQLRLHPAESRVRRLAGETPAELMVFDLLEAGGKSLLDEPLVRRRKALERFHAKNKLPGLLLSPATTDRDAAVDWLRRSGGALDGVVAKRLDLEYRPGERAMVKVKQQRTADCVVGGFRYAEKKKEVGSLLLGLYDDARAAPSRRLHLGDPGEGAARADQGTGKADRAARLYRHALRAGPSRWSTERTAQWQPLKPELVVEVRYDQVTGRRFRHGTGFLRWRPDKDRRNAPSTSSPPSCGRPSSRSCSSASRSRRGTRRPSARRSKR